MSKVDARTISDAVERLERRRRARKLLFAAILIAILVVAFFLIRCGGGFGVGGGGGAGLGGGTASGAKRSKPSATGADAGVRCRIRVDAAGIAVDGKAAPLARVIAVCRAATGADVVVTGDARQGTWDELRDALDAAGVQTFVKDASAGAPIDAGTRR